MKQLVQLKEWKLIDSFNRTLRYLDDILSIDNKEFGKLIYNDTVLKQVRGIYPRQAITLQQVDRSVTINYMDSSISRYISSKKKHYLDNKLYTKTYDKRQSAKYIKLNLIKYPSSKSLISLSIGYNIMNTQCHRFIELDMCKEDFIKDTIRVYRELVQKGFSKKLLLSRTKRFLFKYNSCTLYGSYPMTLFKEITLRLGMNWR